MLPNVKATKIPECCLKFNDDRKQALICHYLCILGRSCGRVLGLFHIASLYFGVERRVVLKRLLTVDMLLLTPTVPS